MVKLDEIVKNVYFNKTETTISSYIKEAVRLHHQLTVIHPFGDGNGRTLRAFYNIMIVRNSLTPMYIKMEAKNEYVEALEIADKDANYAPLFEFFYKSILRANVDLTR